VAKLQRLQIGFQGVPDEDGGEVWRGWGVAAGEGVGGRWGKKAENVCLDLSEGRCNRTQLLSCYARPSRASSAQVQTQLERCLPRKVIEDRFRRLNQLVVDNDPRIKVDKANSCELLAVLGQALEMTKRSDRVLLKWVRAYHFTIDAIYRSFGSFNWIIQERRFLLFRGLNPTVRLLKHVGHI
jgi:hypothetical protein